MPATFGLLFKHNVLIEVALWRRTLFETITVLILLVIILVNPISYTKSLLYSRQYSEDDREIVSHKLDNIDLLKSIVDSRREQTKFNLAYCPNSVFAKQVANAVATRLELNTTIAFEDSDTLQNQFDQRTTLAAIVFEDTDANLETPPKVLSVSIRFPSEFRTLNSFLTEDRLWLTRCSGFVNAKRDNVEEKELYQDIYIRETFLQIQHQVFMEWLHQLRAIYPSSYTEPAVEVFNIRLKVPDERCSSIDVYTVPLFLFNFLYLLPFINILRNIAGQMRNNVFSHQWHYGYGFVKQYLCLILVLFIRLIILNFFYGTGHFFWSVETHNVQPLVFFGMLAFMVIFTLEMIITALAIAKIFGNGMNAVLCGIVLWLFNYAIFGVILRRYWDQHGNYIFLILSSFMSNQIPYCMQMFQRSVEQTHVIHFMDVLALYVSAVFNLLIFTLCFVLLQWRMPGRLISSRVCYSKRRKKMNMDVNIYLGRSPSWHNFEFGDVGSQELLRLRHIYTIQTDTERKVLKNISMRLYRGEIYVLLGHIGSGKLSLLRVMSGIKYPIRGTVFFKGADIYDNLANYRKYCDFRALGNGLCDHLTIEQTINYHVRLKFDTNRMDRYNVERNKWIDILEAQISNRRTRINRLSTGQRHLVGLCCALVTDTKIILLNEPTVELSPREAQIFWSIIAMEKEHRAFVVATNSIDEAEAVGNRIGILSMGVLEASGTPFFLRAKFSSSVELVLIKKPHVPDTPITEFISQYIPGTEPENEIGDTLTYKIDAVHRPLLQKMLIHLENNGKSMGIENIRVVGSEMSDIYMKLVTSFRVQQQVIPDVTQTFKYAVVSRKQLRRQQIRAMFYKKMIHSAPNVWPIIMIFACLILIVAITRLAFVLDVPNMRTNVIPLGFKGATKNIKKIPNIRKCGYIDITSLAKTPAYRKVISPSKVFGPNSFDCAKGSYWDYLKQKTELHSLGAIELESDQKIHGYISQDSFHSAPMTLNLLHNIILRLTYPNDDDIYTLVDNHPMPTSLMMKINLIDNEVAHIVAPLAIGCVLPLTVSMFILPMVEEQKTQIRGLQLIAGLGLDIYWGITLFWDYITYFVHAMIIVIVVACTFIGHFGGFENILLLLLIAVYGAAALPITYVLSMYVNKSMVRAFLASIMFHNLTGLVLYMLYWDVANSNVVFFYGACLSPGFALLDGISNIYIRCLEEQHCRAKCSTIENCTPENMHEMVPHCVFDTYFKWSGHGILPSLLFMSLAAVFTLFLIFWIELHRKEKKFHSSKDLHNLRSVTYPFDDSDVADVKQKIAAADMSKCKQSVFLVDQVEAKIPTKSNRVNTVSFALNKYMSMGIFGPKNSGKSHLIRQLVGIDGFAFGEIYVRGLDFKYDLDTIRGYIGYCPQDHGLLNDLTPREHIRLLCMIRGVAEKKIGEKMHDLCRMLNMTGWMHRRCGALTAEKRRKLNVALSLVAYNKIFVLDEPTSGMPSTTRREIWNILRYLRYCGKTIIFSSNDELECKVLADFIILFQDSEMLAIGSLQYLRYKYSHGFYLEVRLVRDGSTIEESEANLRKDVENLSRFVSFLHDKSELVGRLHNWFKFYIPVGHIVYSFLYGAMEKNKVRLNVYDYCIYQSSMNVVIAQVQDTRAELRGRQVESNLPEESDPPLPIIKSMTERTSSSRPPTSNA
ncbi:phospholipid-transporting ATPase ABCA3 isoform X1 [Drosophila nasuta]|uniref:phospholipid-transporting ATPase ABCA3 isoform X1 n=1 Tax=Drosophila nasuta TaxID=42062 RepID=UPI00295E6663|nr:phospholipid-transporting ATPase ABCA3 isoform X1 [Drosophila nasuta]